MQAVSVGEVEVARRIEQELGRRPGRPPLVVTATTATGLALARSAFAGRHPVSVCPLDLPVSVGRFLDRTRPRALVLVETELWPEMLHQAGRRGLPVIVVNARLSDRAFGRYRRVGPLLRPLLTPVSRVLAREDGDGERFVALGLPPDAIRVVGNVKYDLEPDPRPLPWQPEVEALAAGRSVLVAGSTMAGEEASLLDALDRIGQPLGGAFVVLAPRHPERFAAVADLLTERGIRFVRRSQLGDGPATGADLLLLDTIGELGRAFRLAQVAFIGGSLVPTGGHNPLEPAVWGVPVVTGPHVFNFAEVYRAMVAGGGVRMVADGAELATALQHWLADPAAARDAGARGREVVEANRGATARTVTELLDVAGRGAAP